VRTTANPDLLPTCTDFVYMLEEDVFINQWTTPIDADADGDVDSADQTHSRKHLRNQLCRPRLRDANKNLSDTWHFVGHYPYPPKGRASRTASGLQFYDGAVLTSLLTHTAHPTDYDDPKVKGVDGHKPLSEAANFPIVIVYLQAWNPFHFFTGYVEVNGRYDGGVEHPMVRLASRSTAQCGVTPRLVSARAQRGSARSPAGWRRARHEVDSRCCNM